MKKTNNKSKSLAIQAKATQSHQDKSTEFVMTPPDINFPVSVAGAGIDEFRCTLKVLAIRNESGCGYFGTTANLRKMSYLA